MRQIKTGEENDCYTAWRRMIRWRAGVVKRTKKRTHRRERREGKAEALAQLEDV